MFLFVSELLWQYKGKEKGRITIQKLLDFLEYLTSSIFFVLLGLFPFGSSSSLLLGAEGHLENLLQREDGHIHIGEHLDIVSDTRSADIQLGVQLHRLLFTLIFLSFFRYVNQKQLRTFPYCLF